MRQLLKDHNVPAFLRRHSFKRFAQDRGTGILFSVAFFIIVGLGIQLSTSSVNDIKEDQLANRECLLQLIIGGDYSKDPECQYPSKDYDSLRNELASVSKDVNQGIEDRARIERKIDCVIALHVTRPSGVVSPEEIAECKAAAEVDQSQTEHSSPTVIEPSRRGNSNNGGGSADRRPDTQPNTSPDNGGGQEPEPNVMQRFLNEVRSTIGGIF